MGCGWLGLPLAISLINKGHKVKGTTTSDTKLALLASSGIEAFHIGLTSQEISGPIRDFLRSLDVLIINVPPGLRSNSGSSYVAKMELLHEEIKSSDVREIIFISSTSVYGNKEGEVTEQVQVDPQTESARQLVESEKLFSGDPALKATIIRFGGLIGPDRHPVNRLAGRTELTNGDDMVNLIHLDDCIHMISTILENNWWDQVFNGVYPEHPRKADYYKSEASKRDLQPPHYAALSGIKKGKKVISKNFLIKKQKFYTSIFS